MHIIVLLLLITPFVSFLCLLSSPRYGMVWHVNMVWYRLYDMVWHGVVWHGHAMGMEWYGMAWCGMAWHGMAWDGMA